MKTTQKPNGRRTSQETGREIGRKVGLISDTHGLLRPDALEALAGVDRIIHAGDIDFSGILDELARIAPVHAVLGNMDRHNGLRHLPRFDIIETGGIAIGVIHDRDQLDLDPAAAELSVVVYGHSHRPSVEEKEGVIFINPGSTGPRRFKLPVTLGFLHIAYARVTPEIIELEK